DYENTYVIPSRQRFIKHLVEGNTEAAVAEMETSLKRLQRVYLSRVQGAAAEGAAPPVRKRRTVAAKKAT
ncbi:MAG: hypothetical protein Q7J84_05700, partial [Sulfuricaulis sp.]|nr:hypothetical protein [Sulfuricaulis sp.]